MMRPLSSSFSRHALRAVTLDAIDAAVPRDVLPAFAAARCRWLVCAASFIRSATPMMMMLVADATIDAMRYVIFFPRYLRHACCFAPFTLLYDDVYDIQRDVWCSHVARRVCLQMPWFRIFDAAADATATLPTPLLRSCRRHGLRASAMLPRCRCRRHWLTRHLAALMLPRFSIAAAHIAPLPLSPDWCRLIALLFAPFSFSSSLFFFHFAAVIFLWCLYSPLFATPFHYFMIYFADALLFLIDAFFRYCFHDIDVFDIIYCHWYYAFMIYCFDISRFHLMPPLRFSFIAFALFSPFIYFDVSFLFFFSFLDFADYWLFSFIIFFFSFYFILPFCFHYFHYFHWWYLFSLPCYYYCAMMRSADIYIAITRRFAAVGALRDAAEIFASAIDAIRCCHAARRFMMRRARFALLRAFSRRYWWCCCHALPCYVFRWHCATARLSRCLMCLMLFVWCHDHHYGACCHYDTFATRHAPPRDAFHIFFAFDAFTCLIYEYFATLMFIDYSFIFISLIAFFFFGFLLFASLIIFAWCYAVVDIYGCQMLLHACWRFAAAGCHSGVADIISLILYWYYAIIIFTLIYCRYLRFRFAMLHFSSFITLSIYFFFRFSIIFHYAISFCLFCWFRFLSFIFSSLIFAYLFIWCLTHFHYFLRFRFSAFFCSSPADADITPFHFHYFLMPWFAFRCHCLFEMLMRHGFSPFSHMLAIGFCPEFQLMILFFASFRLFWHDALMFQAISIFFILDWFHSYYFEFILMLLFIDMPLFASAFLRLLFLWCYFAMLMLLFRFFAFRLFRWWYCFHMPLRHAFFFFHIAFFFH